MWREKVTKEEKSEVNREKSDRRTAGLVEPATLDINRK